MGEAFSALTIVHRDSLVREALASLASKAVLHGLVVSYASLEEMVGERKLFDTPIIVIDETILRKSGSHLSAVRRTVNDAKLVVVASDLIREKVVSAIVDGASGYIAQTMEASQIEEALRLIWQGKTYIPCLPERYSDPAINYRVEEPVPARLTARQRDVLYFLRMGKSNKEIARELSISQSTVKVHVAAIFHILNVKNRFSAIVRSSSPPSSSRLNLN